MKTRANNDETTTTRPEQFVPAADVCFFMRVNGVTIRSLAATLQITLKVVRRWRTEGIAGPDCSAFFEAL